MGSLRRSTAATSIRIALLSALLFYHHPISFVYTAALHVPTATCLAQASSGHNQRNLPSGMGEAGQYRRLAHLPSFTYCDSSSSNSLADRSPLPDETTLRRRGPKGQTPSRRNPHTSTRTGMRRGRNRLHPPKPCFRKKPTLPIAMLTTDSSSLSLASS